MARKFIVTADDFGISPIINIAVRNAIAVGAVNSVACFANGVDANGNPSMQSIIDLANDFPHVSIGCHFTITSGKRVHPDSKSLGRKNRKRKFKGALGQHPDLAQGSELEDELNAQLARFESAGIPVDHFSDHHGLISYTESGTRALTRVISDYALRTGREVTMRNPVFIGCTNHVEDTCLEGSALVARANLGLAIKNTFRASTVQKLKLKKRNLEATLRSIHQAGIHTTDYFIESFYSNASRKTLKCIHRNTPGIKYHINNAVDSDHVYSELMVHLAIPPGQELSEVEYEREIKALKDYSGVAIGYLRTKRVTEYNKLIRYFNTSFPTSELAPGFVRTIIS